MISTLQIKNIGIINDLSIDFNNGFNVLTGETRRRKNINNRFSTELYVGADFQKK